MQMKKKSRKMKLVFSSPDKKKKKGERTKDSEKKNVGIYEG